MLLTSWHHQNLYTHTFTYNTLKNSQHPIENQNASCGKHIIFPSSFVGSQMYMDQLYFYGMAICSTVRFPDLFLTFTCNPKWLESQRSIAALNLTAQDRPDIVTRVFKLKLQQLMSDLKDKKILGNVFACKFFVHNTVSTHLTIACIFIVKLTRLQLQISTQ